MRTDVRTYGWRGVAVCDTRSPRPLRVPGLKSAVTTDNANVYVVTQGGVSRLTRTPATGTLDCSALTSPFLTWTNPCTSQAIGTEYSTCDSASECRRVEPRALPLLSVGRCSLVVGRWCVSHSASRDSVHQHGLARRHLLPRGAELHQHHQLHPGAARLAACCLLLAARCLLGWFAYSLVAWRGVV